VFSNIFDIQMIMSTAMFDHLVTSLGINPGLPVPDKVNAIQMSSSIANTIQLMAAFGHDCTAYKMIFAGLVPVNTTQSAGVLGTAAIKICLRNYEPDANWSTMMQSYFGDTTMWDKIFIAYPNTEYTYVNTLATAQRASFLSYSMLTLQDSSILRDGAVSVTSLSTANWLQAIKQHYGETYYQEVLDYFTGGHEQIWTYKQNEVHIYGSSRLGVATKNTLFAHQPVYAGQTNYVSADGDSSVLYSYASDSIKTFYRGEKRYELSNHLGNVLAVITDRRIQACGAGEYLYYEAQTVSVSDYYPFGMQVKDRSWSDSSYSYRFGFNGKESDDEVSGSGNQYDYGFRIYNPRLGKFLSVDPLSKSYPWLTPYQFANNSSISAVDLDGLEYFYAADGRLLGNIGKNENVYLVAEKDIAATVNLISQSKEIEQKINYVEKDHGLSITDRMTLDFNEVLLTRSNKAIGLTNGELNTRAFLTTIRQAENSSNVKVSQDPLAYNVIYGGETFSDYSKHPNKTVTKWSRTSSAAGAYQFLSGRWSTISKILELEDFSPESQDQGALFLIREQNTDNPRAQGVIEDVKSGNISDAAIKLNGTWTSLPEGKEKKMTSSEFSKEFKENISDELRGATKVATPKGKLKL
jgi:RHS repeat-associated protein